MTVRIPPPPPGLNYVAAIEPSLSMLLLDTVLSSILVPILIILFYFSTPTTRWKPIFVMNIMAIALALALAAINMRIQTRAILANAVNPATTTALICMAISAPFFAELVLVLRVGAVYPPSTMSWPARLLVYFPIAALKTARVVNIIIFVLLWERQNADSEVQYNPLQPGGQAAWSLPNVKIEWFLQFFDMTFVSILFLERLHRSTRMKRKARLLDSSSGLSTGTSHTTFSSRVRTLFWIAASNLVIPVLLIFVQLVYVFHDNNFLHGAYVYIVNIHLQIIGVLFATIWRQHALCTTAVDREAASDGNDSLGASRSPQACSSTIHNS
ncbi:hypothetical protein C8Q70DRAFT_413386 [Cubamyces menziesii]|nr:hypothetical protein C8Q70DRAFT_413386 [Cubamyces menziesii]